MKTKNKQQPYHLELHFSRPLFSEMTHLSSVEDTDVFIREIINVGRLNHKEYVWIILLSYSNRVLGFKEISSGTTHSSCISFKEIAQTALLANASSCILVHNHPSGNCNPSTSDLSITKKAKNALALIDVTLLDHFIITQEQTYSFVAHHHI